MNRNSEYQFVSTDMDEMIASMTSKYEELTNVTVRPASPEQLFIRYVANLIMQERANINYVGNQNIPSRASGANLDALGELLYSAERPAAQAAVCTERFYISEAQDTAILVPAGTRVTDTGRTVIWETVTDAFVQPGDTYTDVQVRCQTPGVGGNGFAVGQINTCVDLYDYYSRCENITSSDDGADAASDEEYYDLMRLSIDRLSTAGARGTYIYWAKSVSTKIADVVANSPGLATVAIYTLMDDGTLASEEIKKAVLEACSDRTRRPLTDWVKVEDGEEVEYDVTLTYYIPSEAEESAATIQRKVNEAVEKYVKWQCGKFGRDINPDKLRSYLFETGIKRVDMTAPVFTLLHDGNETDAETHLAKYKPQIAKVRTIKVTSGGYEDE